MRANNGSNKMGVSAGDLFFRGGNRVVGGWDCGLGQVSSHFIGMSIIFLKITNYN